MLCVFDWKTFELPNGCCCVDPNVLLPNGDGVGSFWGVDVNIPDLKMLFRLLLFWFMRVYKKKKK